MIQEQGNGGTRLTIQINQIRKLTSSYMALVRIAKPSGWLDERIGL